MNTAQERVMPTKLGGDRGLPVTMPRRSARSCHRATAEARNDAGKAYRRAALATGRAMTLLTRFRVTYAVGCLGLFGFLLPLFFIGPTAALNGSPVLAVAFWSLAVVGLGGMALAYFVRCPQCGLSLLCSSKRWDRAGVKGLMISCAGCGYDLRNAETMRRYRKAADRGDA